MENKKRTLRKKKSDNLAKDKVIESTAIPSFEEEIGNFVLSVESLARATAQTMKVVTTSLKKSGDAFEQFLEAKGVNTTKEDGKPSYQITPDSVSAFEKHIKDLTASSLAVKKVPQIFFCALIHQYDAYLGKLLRVAFFVKPELLNASQRQLSFEELMKLNSIDAAREYLIEKEIESVIRESHDSQFSWMENRFGLVLRKDLPIWPTFVEMTERRNLFVHCDGNISSQYLSVCQKHSVNFEEQCAIGEQLEVTPQYFNRTVDCILEMGVKLGHVIWRKLQPDALANADMALLNTTFDLLLDERYPLARILLHFAVNALKKHSSDEIRRIHLINLAIAHYYSGEKKEAHELLDGHDWSACTDRFKLAVAVLHDNYKDAAKLMIKIGKSGEVSRSDYSSWPLFREFRKSKEFLNAYRKLFGKSFLIREEDTEKRLETDKRSQQAAQPDSQ